MRLAWLILLFGLFWTNGPLLCQQDELFDGVRRKIGFIAGYGDQRWLSVNYEYEVVFFQAQYSYAFHRRPTWGLEVLVQPQYNRTTYRPIDVWAPFEDGHEYGLNVGIVIRKNFFDDLLSIYFLGSVGPHYISGAPQRQQEGFIFSDNLFIGASVRLYKSFYIDLRPGFRHISNAGIDQPSAGINNVVFSGGFFVLF